VRESLGLSLYPSDSLTKAPKIDQKWRAITRRNCSRRRPDPAYRFTRGFAQSVCFVVDVLCSLFHMV
jgi:hypothetical protein